MAGKEIIGSFEGSFRRHPFNFGRVVADGQITYKRDVGGQEVEVTTSVRGVKVRCSGDRKNFIRIRRGPRKDSDRVIGSIDQDDWSKRRN